MAIRPPNNGGRLSDQNRFSGRRRRVLIDVLTRVHSGFLGRLHRVQIGVARASGGKSGRAAGVLIERAVGISGRRGRVLMCALTHVHSGDSGREQAHWES